MQPDQKNFHSLYRTPLSENGYLMSVSQSHSCHIHDNIKAQFAFYFIIQCYLFTNYFIFSIYFRVHRSVDVQGILHYLSLFIGHPNTYVVSLPMSFTALIHVFYQPRPLTTSSRFLAIMQLSLIPEIALII